MIPAILYRGDSDPKGIRSLKARIDHGQFLTTLLNGGTGKKIFKAPFQNLINQHVREPWTTSHFLSFTEDENIAKRYGIGCKLEEYLNPDFALGSYGQT